jgi:hypothetical protein
MGNVALRVAVWVVVVTAVVGNTAVIVVLGSWRFRCVIIINHVSITVHNAAFEQHEILAGLALTSMIARTTKD